MPSAAEVDVFILKSRVNRGTSHSHFIRKIHENVLQQKEDVTKNKESWDIGNSRTNPGKQWRGFLGWEQGGMPGEQSVFKMKQGSWGGDFWVKEK